MSEPRALYPLKASRESVLTDLVSGKSAAEIARKYGVSIEAVQRYQNRHQHEIEPMRQAVLDSVKEHAIAEKRWRIGELQSLYDAVDAHQQENGLREVTRRYDSRTGELLGETYSFAGEVVREKRAILKDAAAELDQLPRAGVNVDNRVQILIREVNGIDPQLLG